MGKTIAQFETITDPTEYDMDELMRMWRLIFGTPGKINDVTMKESHCIMKKYESGKIEYRRVRKPKDILPYLKDNWAYKSCNIYIGRDAYINGATFFNSTTLFSIKNICIDIDNHNADPEETRHQVNAFLLDLQEQRRKHKIPLPNTVVYTGHGIQLWYHLKSASAKLYKIANKIAEALCKKFQEFISASPMAYADLEVDIAASVRCCGLFRLPGSYHPEAKCFTQGIVLSTRKWDVNDLLTRAGVPDKPQKEKRKITEKKEETGRSNNRARFSALLFRTLREAAEAGDYTSREVLSHVYHSLALLHGADPETAEESVQEFNQLFANPLSDKEIQDLVRCDNRNCYHYSEKKAFTYPGISNERAEAYFHEKKFLYKLRDYRQENAKRDQKRLAERITWQNEIRTLRQQGYSFRAISEMTGRCRQTVAKYADKPMEDVEQTIGAMTCASSAKAQEKARPATVPAPAAPTELDRKHRAVQLYKRGFRAKKIAAIMQITEEEAEEHLAKYKEYRRNRKEVRYAQYRVSLMGKRITSYQKEGYKKLAKMDQDEIKDGRKQRVVNLIDRLYYMANKKASLASRLQNINPKSADQIDILPVVLSEFSDLQKSFGKWLIDWSGKI